MHHSLQIDTPGRALIDISDRVAARLGDWSAGDGLLHLFIAHTSASLLISENADPDVLIDLERFLSDLVPDGDPRFRHRAEGPDDMPAHIRSALTASSLWVPVRHGRLLLGTWQGLYLWEHRHRPQRRQIWLSLLR